MTDLGKRGALGQCSQSLKEGRSFTTIPQPVGAFQEVGLFSAPEEALAFYLVVSLSDEQEDESMENTGKVEPV